MPTENEWTKNRLCAVCGGPFSLEAHGTAEAQSAAQFLQQGILNAAELPPLISRCPKCLNTGQLSEREAVAAVREMGLELEADDSQQTLQIVRQGGVLVSLLGATGLLLVFAFARLTKGEFNPTFYYAVFALLTVAGVGAAAWAFIRLDQLDDSSKNSQK